MISREMYQISGYRVEVGRESRVVLELVQPYTAYQIRVDSRGVEEFYPLEVRKVELDRKSLVTRIKILETFGQDVSISKAALIDLDATIVPEIEHLDLFALGGWDSIDHRFKSRPPHNGGEMK